MTSTVPGSGPTSATARQPPARRPDLVDVGNVVSTTPAMADGSGDCLAVALREYFRDHVECPVPPEAESEETEHGWPSWADDRARDLIDRIAVATMDHWRPYVDRILHERDMAILSVRKEIWLPIEQADRSVAVVMTFGDVTIRNSHPVWVRDADGRVYQAVWSEDRRGYWWDLDGQEQADPVEFQPHPQEATADLFGSSSPAGPLVDDVVASPSEDPA